MDSNQSPDRLHQKARGYAAQAEAELWELVTTCGIKPALRYGLRGIINGLVADVQAIYAMCNNSLNPLQNIVTELTSIAETFHEYAILPSKPALKRTRTRAQVWNEIEAHPNTRANLDVPTQADPTTALAHTAHDIASSLACLSPAHNANNYSQAATILETFFNQQTLFGPTYGLDTHRHRFLDDFSPDICVQRNASGIDKFNVALVLDIKHSHLSTSANKGQILDYLHSLASCQPGRKTFLGVLTDFKSAELIKMVVGVPKARRRRISDHMADTTTLVRHYRSQPLSDILNLAYAELSAPEANPCKLSLSPLSGTLVKVLQLSPQTVVAVVRASAAARTCVVKAALNKQGSLDISREVEILKSLQHASKQPTSIPSIIYSLPSEFAIEPVGKAFRLEAFENTKDLRAALGDVVCALEWVHNHNLVHRDVRADNLVLVRDRVCPDRSIRAVLIDFDRSTVIGKTTTYEGGYICCPEEVLHKLCSHAHSGTNPNPHHAGDPDTPMSMSFKDEVEGAGDAPHAPLDFITYTPHPKHDFLAFVILLNQLLFPFIFQRYAYHLVEKVDTKEQRKLFDLWRSLKGSRVWGPIVDCAEKMGGGGRVAGDWEAWLEIVVLL